MSNLKENYQPFWDSLDKLGFCTFQVFEDKVIEQLMALYNGYFSDKKIEGLYANHNSNTAQQGLQISNAIRDLVSEGLTKVFPDYNYFLGHFVIKAANVGREFALHQDWNIVEESRHKSYQVWIPLQLTYPLNGGMFVVPGSHRFFNNYRSGSYGIPVIPYRKELDPILTNVVVPAGNVLIYHNALFHGSHPNHTNENRIAVIVNFVEKDAPTYFFQREAEKNITALYDVTGNQLISHLSDLEKGKVSADLCCEREIEISQVDNEKIGYEDLISCFKAAFPSVEAAQMKQIHIVRDESLEERLNETGYAIIDLLDEGSIRLFKDNYQALFGNIDRQPGRFTTLQDTDAHTKKQVHEFIVTNMRESLQRYFKDFSIPVSQYYTKKAFTSGDIDLHADSTLLINHQAEPHYAIWVPLVDVDENNGTLTVVPNSHKINNAFFGGSFTGYHLAHREWLRQYEVPIRLKAGQAIIFDNNLLHNSTANNTSEDRLCLTFRITHFASQYYSFIKGRTETNDLELFSESHNYYMNDQWDGDGLHISGKYAGTIKHGIIEISQELLHSIIG